MSSYHTSTKTDNGKAINDDDPQYKGLTNNKSEEHKAFATSTKSTR